MRQVADLVRHGRYAHEVMGLLSYGDRLSADGLTG
jgi:hypothetical protein